jgi:hypothetical protein
VLADEENIDEEEQEEEEKENTNPSTDSNRPSLKVEFTPKRISLNIIDI